MATTANRMLRFACSGAALVVLLACGGGEIGTFEAKNVKVICGTAERPCNADISAPVELEHACVFVDGSPETSLVNDRMRHPLRSLVLQLLGAEAKSTRSAALFFLPKGSHIVRVVKPGWQPIDCVIGDEPRKDHLDIIITKAELMPALTSPARSESSPETRTPARAR